MLQRGGARDHLLGTEYIPDITNVDEMVDKVDFFTSISHSDTDVNKLIIIPENTFVVYTGSAGFTTYVGSKIKMTSLGTMNFYKLLNPSSFRAGTPAENLRAYHNALFRNFFQGNYDLYRFCLLYTSPSPRDRQKSRMPSSA